MADRIELRRLRLVGTHGVLPEEQARPQPFEVDVVLELDLSAAAATDDLSATVDYAAVVDAVAAVVTGERHALLERLASRIVDVALADARVEGVEVRVAKLRPPVAHDLAEAAVRLVRRRRPAP